MNSEKGYIEYVRDNEFLEDYNQYQKKYESNPRQSDIALMDIVANIIDRSSLAGQASILDIGCSTGNFIRQLRRRFPDARLVGADLAASSLEICRQDPALSGVSFEQMDMVNMADGPTFDIIIANAVTFYFENDEYDRALHGIARRLKRGGTYVAFEWLHPFNQDLRIVEKSVSHPLGLVLHQRPYQRVRETLEAAGFNAVEFKPFNIGIDLPMPDPAGNVLTYTKKLESGEHMCFRGTLFQPWCFMIATKI